MEGRAGRTSRDAQGPSGTATQQQEGLSYLVVVVCGWVGWVSGWCDVVEETLIIIQTPAGFGEGKRNDSKGSAQSNHRPQDTRPEGRQETQEKNEKERETTVVGVAAKAARGEGLGQMDRASGGPCSVSTRALQLFFFFSSLFPLLIYTKQEHESEQSASHNTIVIYFSPFLPLPSHYNPRPTPHHFFFSSFPFLLPMSMTTASPAVAHTPCSSMMCVEQNKMVEGGEDSSRSRLRVTSTTAVTGLPT